jgi:cobalt/nickel transport system permease protein
MSKMVGMPEWLLKDENYTPLSDKDTFINKSILSLLSVLSRIKTQGNAQTGKYRLNTTVQLAGTLLLIVLASIAKSFVFVVIINVYLLVVLSLMPAEKIIGILKASFAITIFSVIILMPAAVMGSWHSMIMIPSKTFATVTAVSILSRSTRWSSVTSALKRFFIPDIFIFVLDITIKYIVMLGDLSLSMLYSLKLRSVGRNKSKYSALSGIAGTMFIKSKEMAEELYAAMECRGFTGEYPVSNQLQCTLTDYIYIAINIGMVLIFAYLY